MSGETVNLSGTIIQERTKVSERGRGNHHLEPQITVCSELLFVTSSSLAFFAAHLSIPRKNKENHSKSLKATTFPQTNIFLKK